MRTIRYYRFESGRTLYPIDFFLGYLSKDHIYVYTDEPEEELYYDWVNDNQIQLKQPIPINKELKIQRIVPKEPFNKFENEARLSSKNLDTSFIQALMLHEEILDGFLGKEFIFQSLNVIIKNLEIVNNLKVPDPKSDDDAVNKKYVDDLVNNLEELVTNVIEEFSDYLEGEKLELIKYISDALEGGIVQGYGSHYVSEVVPETFLRQGISWYKPSDCATYVYFCDDDSCQWVQEAANTIIVGGGSGMADQFINDHFEFDQTTGTLFVKPDRVEFLGSEIIGNFTVSDEPDFLAVGHLNSPRYSCYVRLKDFLVKVADPDVFSGGISDLCAINKHKLVAASHGVSPFFSVYRYDSYEMKRLTMPTLTAHLPTSSGYITISPDGTRCVVTSGSGTNFRLNLYSINENSVDFISSIPVSDTNLINRVRFSPDGNLLVLCKSTIATKSIEVYRKSTTTPDTFVELVNYSFINNLSSIKDVAFMSNSQDFYVTSVGGNENPKLVHKFKVIGESCVEEDIPKVGDFTNGETIRVSSDDKLLAVGRFNGQGVNVFAINEDLTLTQLPLPSIPFVNADTYLDFSPKTDMLVIGENSAPRMTVLKINEDYTFTVINTPSTMFLPNSAVKGMSFGRVP